MAGKKLYMGAILSDLSSKMESVSANMVTVAEKLVDISQNTSQSIVSLTVASDVSVDAEFFGAGLTSKNVEKEQVTSSYVYDEVGSFTSFSAGTIAFKFDSLMIGRHADSYDSRLTVQLILKVNGVTVFTGTAEDRVGTALSELNATIENIPVAVNDVISWGFQRKGPSAAVNYIKYTTVAGAAGAYYKLANKIADGGFISTV